MDIFNRIRTALHDFGSAMLVTSWQTAAENYFDNPFEDYEDKDFTQLPLREKVKVLHQLCEYRLEVMRYPHSLLMGKQGEIPPRPSGGVGYQP
jgi:hypothetical protein